MRAIVFSALLFAASASLAQPLEPPRPRVGLVLSGGGARGLAHVGVLRALQQMRVPVDVVAGTSMGAVVGGLLASGMTPDEIEAALAEIDWTQLFEQRVSRAEVPPRRKEEDFFIAAGVELGVRDGALRMPQGTVSSRGLESLIRHHTLRALAVTDFDALPIPFRAVATDMETGQAVVQGSGDLAQAMRASMSVPGVFASVEVDGRVLGDGGLVDNVPMDVARAMGAERLIVVNVGTPLAGRETLTSALGLTTQMINILTEQNVQRSLATLAPTDVLITPQLAELSSGDFSQAARFVALGREAAEAMRPQLLALAVSPETYAGHRARRLPALAPQVLQSVAIEGTAQSNPARLVGLLRSRPGEVFDPATAARDARQLAATGDYVRTDYRLVQGDSGLALVLDAEDKPWGPNYVRLGLDLFTDLSGNSAFNLKLGHTRRWLTADGTEWRNYLQIGAVPTLFTELYHPLVDGQPQLGLGDGGGVEWFLAPSLRMQRQVQSLYAAGDPTEVGRVLRTEGRLALDAGRTWGSWGEWRLGLVSRLARHEPLLLGQDYAGPTAPGHWREVALRTRVLADQLDYANFPQQGWRLEAEASVGRRLDSAEGGRVLRLESQATWAQTWGAHTLNLHGRLQLADMPTNALFGAYSLGGFQQLSGYQPGQVAGDAVALARAAWYVRLLNPPVFARALFAGGSLEAGQAWSRQRDINLNPGSWRGGASLYLGADTNIGPMYLALTWAPRGEPGLMLFMGRP